MLTRGQELEVAELRPFHLITARGPATVAPVTVPWGLAEVTCCVPAVSVVTA